MAITVTRSHYDAPTLSLSLLAGGSLPIGVTLYYRVATSSYLYPYQAGRYTSAPSTMQSITTDAAHRSVKLDITHSTGNAEYTQVWVYEGADPGVGNWSNPDYPLTRYLGWSSTFKTVTGAKLTTWTDDGTSYGWSHSTCQIGDGTTQNSAFCPVYEAGRDRLDVSGGTELTPATMQNIYDAVVAAGWNPDASVNKMDVPWGDTWMIRAGSLYITGYFEVKSETLIFDGSNFDIHGPITFGEDGGDTPTKSHVSVLLVGHSYMFGSVFFNDDVTYYGGTLLIKKFPWSYPSPYGSDFRFNSGTALLRRLKIDAYVYGQGLNSGLYISGGAVTLDHVVCSQARYGMFLTSATPPIIDGLQIDQHVRIQHFDGTPRALRNVEFLTDYCLWLYIAKAGSLRSIVNLVVPVGFSDDLVHCIYWYKYGSGTFEDVSRVWEQYTVNLRISDGTAALSGATITIKDNTGATVATATAGADGTISEQIVTVRQFKPNLSLGASHYQDPDHITDYGSHTIEVAADGYQTETWTGNIREAVDWEVVLKADIPAVPAELVHDVRATLAGGVTGRVTTRRIVARVGG